MPDAIEGIGELRPGPWASGVPSRARIDARGGSVIVRDRRSPGRSPGNTSVLEKRMAGEEPLSSIGTSSVWRSAPKATVRTSIRTGTTEPCSPCWRSARSESSVAVCAAVW